MSRTNSPSVSVYNYSVTSYVNSGGASPTYTFNIAFSAETSSNLIGYLSGNSTVATPTLSGVLSFTAVSGLSATPTGIVLAWPSIRGGTTTYGLVTTSSVIPATSAFTVSIEFNELNFYTNTLVNLSGNTSTFIVDYPGVPTPTTFDNPFVDIGNSLSNVNTNNITFWTVGEKLRRGALNG